MTVTDQRMKYCMDCIYFMTPPYSTAECHAPSVIEGMPTRQCRDTDGPCGPSAKLWEKSHGRLEQI